MRRVVILLVLTSLTAFGKESPVLRTTHAIAAELSNDVCNGSFDFVGKITYVRPYQDGVIAAEDEYGAIAMWINLKNRNDIKPGITAHFRGKITRHGNNQPCARLLGCTIINEGNAAEPSLSADLSKLLDGAFDFRYVRISGMLRDVSYSETYPGWIYLVVCDRHESIYIPVPDTRGALRRLRALIGTRVTAKGICLPTNPSARLTVGRTFDVACEKDIEPADDICNRIGDLPSIDEIRCSSISEVRSLGRHKVIGKVVAVWHGNRVLVRRKDGTIVGLELSRGPAPHYGETIEAIGLPESDLYRINLFNTTWTSLATPLPDIRPAVPISPTAITQTRNGYEIINSTYHGQPIALVGPVRSIAGDCSGRFHLECDGILVTVEAGSCPNAIKQLSVGCKVEVKGTCIMEHEHKASGSAFPRIKNFIVVLRTEDDLFILEYPPWWTPQRLVSVIGALLLGLVGILAWNMSLRKIAARKGRELMREQLSHVKAQLKTEERTRLAVELHDSLAQNLTGVSLEIDTAAKVADEDLTSMKTHLRTAARSLKSCRDELRNCLWDLRNRALEAKTMDDAIQQTLTPHIAGVELVIRFNVPRARISDNTAHAILRIIRELTLNGIRHGKATKIWIAGSLDGAKLKFSVRDNGSGFNPKEAPGFSLGHYGLLGIRERIDAFEGEFRIDSTPSKGTKATIAILAPQEEDE